MYNKWIFLFSGAMQCEETAPHMLRGSKWLNLWLRVSPGLVELGHGDLNLPFLEWSVSMEENHLKIDPLYIRFTTTANSTIGVNFSPNDCLVRLVTEQASREVWPVAFNDGEIENKISFSVLGNGRAAWSFFLLPGRQILKFILKVFKFKFMLFSIKVTFFTDWVIVIRVSNYFC